MHLLLAILSSVGSLLAGCTALYAIFSEDTASRDLKGLTGKGWALICFAIVGTLIAVVSTGFEAWMNVQGEVELVERHEKVVSSIESSAERLESLSLKATKIQSVALAIGFKPPARMFFNSGDELFVSASLSRRGAHIVLPCELYPGDPVEAGHKGTGIIGMPELDKLKAGVLSGRIGGLPLGLCSRLDVSGIYMEESLFGFSGRVAIAYVQVRDFNRRAEELKVGKTWPLQTIHDLENALCHVSITGSQKETVSKVQLIVNGRYVAEAKRSPSNEAEGSEYIEFSAERVFSCLEEADPDSLITKKFYLTP